MKIEAKPIVFSIIVTFAILIGTIVTMVLPMFLPSTQPSKNYVKPYTAIELEGRDIYIREGCNNCHSQVVRPLRTEVLRYGEYSKAEEYAYDRPHLWGSRRMGPDLSRVGGKYPDVWHYNHTVAPQKMFPRSNMPPYKWLATHKLDTRDSYRKTKTLGYGYSETDVAANLADYKTKVTAPDFLAKSVRDHVTPVKLQGELTELDALIAYLQKLGRDIKAASKPEAAKQPEASAKTVDPVVAGKAIFQENCVACHGVPANSDSHMNLADNKWEFGSDLVSIKKTITNGRENEGMPTFGKLLTADQIDQVAHYVLSGIKR